MPRAGGTNGTGRPAPREAGLRRSAPGRRPPLGQHFLRSGAVLQDILDAARVRPGERVLEIGPGEGVLTRPLLDAVGPEGRVVAVEVDAGLARRLREGAPQALRVLQGDAVRVDLEQHGPFDRVVSNLPYQISGPVTARLLALMGSMPWRRAVLLVQKEFGLRLAAGAGSKAYGRLSVYASRWCRVEKVREVPPGCFEPPPQVDSVVVRLEPHAASPFEVTDERLWHAVVDAAFQQRRKKLRNTLPPALQALGIGSERTGAALRDVGLADHRPEQTPPAAFAALVEALS